MAAAAVRAASKVRERLVLVAREGSARGPLSEQDFEVPLAAAAPFLDALVLRDPSASSEQRAALCRRARVVLGSAASAPRLLLGEGDVEAAGAGGADGLHVPSRVWSTWEGESPERRDERAARLGALAGGEGRGFLSMAVHTPEEASRAALLGADMLLLGTLFPTPSHPSADHVTIGPEACGAAAAAVRSALGGAQPPWIVGIGGLDASNCGLATGAGADGCAVVRAVWAAADPAAACRELRAAMRKELVKAAWLRSVGQDGGTRMASVEEEAQAAYVGRARAAGNALARKGNLKQASLGYMDALGKMKR